MILRHKGQNRRGNSVENLTCLALELDFNCGPQKEAQSNSREIYSTKTYKIFALPIM